MITSHVVSLRILYQLCVLFFVSSTVRALTSSIAYVPAQIRSSTAINLIIMQIRPRSQDKKLSIRALILLAGISIATTGCTCFSPVLGHNAPALQRPTQPLPLAADRIRNEPASVWVEFIQLALDYKPLNLGQGFPDFAAPKYLVESLENATKLSDSKTVLNHQYTRSFGHPRLVNALQAYYRKMRGFEELVDSKEQILVTVGAYEALFTAIMAFVNPGDEVILIDPAFDAYAPMVAMAGGKSVFVPLRLPAGQHNSSSSSSGISSELYKLDMQELSAKVTNRTRAIVLNTPNNPLGKIYSMDELKELANICVHHNLLVIADEVYEQFYYDSNEHISMASLPGMWERTVTIGSAGKTFSVTGWKIGWAFGPKHLIRYMQLIHQTAVYTVATPLQEAVARALENEMQLVVAHHGSALMKMSAGDGHDSMADGLYWSSLRAELRAKRNRMAKTLEKANMRPIIPQGGYFMMADFSKWAKMFPEFSQVGRADHGQAINTNDYKFARWLSKSKHLQGIPGSAFYSGDNKSLGENLIRLCFIKKNETLDRFEDLINQLVKE
jgi:kynurenine--oxoglutarate transaminase/cysteine-S-conjugate beta-lyase/glutamine--phenylpyruvate transaminase